MNGAELLEGPRGRSLCLELAERLDARVREALFDLAYNADIFSGASIVRFGIDENGRSFQSSDPISQPRFSLEELAGAITDAVQDAAQSGLDPIDIGDALQRSVDLAAYWQPPRGEEIVAVEPLVLAALRPLADAVVAHPSTAWWTRERTAEQWSIQWDPTGDGEPFDPAWPGGTEWAAAARDEEETAARERPADPTANWGGSWWSVPWRMPTTTGETPDGVPVKLPLVEDPFGWERAVAVPVRGAGTVLEIRSAADWTALCERFPFEVTASRRHDWYRATGHAGTWIIPEWSKVAEVYDGIHLSVWAYLTASGKALPLADGRATMIAGFEPDATAWLTGRLRDVEGPRVHWRAIAPTDTREQTWAREP